MEKIVTLEKLSKISSKLKSKGKKIILLKSKVIKNNKKNIEPGKILFPINSKTVIKCGNDAICFLKTQPKIKLKVGNYI